ncbi:MAG: twin-arginine translocase TatA/TatE family subunit [Bacteroidota bacterium]|nr:twin-arginine translocase TatA/TatE family subunit [Bacteroidota bacterium]
MFENIGVGELTLILLVIIIFFGPKKIPDLARGLGKGIAEFKRAMRDVESELTKPVVTPEPPQSSKGLLSEKASGSEKPPEALHSEQKIYDDTLKTPSEQTRTQH